MAVALLTSVGFDWKKHPHRLHTMRIDPSVPGGIDVVGGPWTNGERSTDVIVSHTSWDEIPGTEGDQIDLELRSADGPGIAEVRWPLEGPGSGDVVAVTGLLVESTSHPAGFNLSGWGVGVDTVDGRSEAWLRVTAGKVPDRPERFDTISIAATMTVAIVRAADGEPAIDVERVRTHGRTKGGFRPRHLPFLMPEPGGTASAVAGWSWNVTDAPKAPGRYLARLHGRRRRPRRHRHGDRRGGREGVEPGRGHPCHLARPVGRRHREAGHR